MKKNLITASLIAAGLALWLLSGLFVERPEPMADTRTSVLVDEPQQRMRVRVTELQAQQRTLTHMLRGKTENKRVAEVSAETSGRVVARPVERGDRVQAGDLLCELALDDRAAALTQAQAELEQAEISYRGSLELLEQELLSDIQFSQVEAELAAARATVKRQELNLSRRLIAAPFDGVVENLHLDVGDLATMGTPCATLLDPDPLLITANVSERDIDFIALGQTVTARTSTDQPLEGVVTFVGLQSNPITRTYPVEITVPNPDLRIRAGLTTVVSVAAETILAHRVSPALFTLNDAGVVGLRAVDANDRVVFHPIEVVEDAESGAWVTGLPGVVRLITVGHEFVSHGERVDVQLETPTTASRL